MSVAFDVTAFLSDTNTDAVQDPSPKAADTKPAFTRQTKVPYAGPVTVLTVEYARSGFANKNDDLALEVTFEIPGVDAATNIIQHTIWLNPHGKGKKNGYARAATDFDRMGVSPKVIGALFANPKKVAPDLVLVAPHLVHYPRGYNGEAYANTTIMSPKGFELSAKAGLIPDFSNLEEQDADDDDLF
mgnify:CR=1 FL=1